MTQYHFQDISFLLPDGLDIDEEQRKTVIKSEDWILTFSIGTVGGQGSSMTPWEAFKMVMKDTHQDFKNTTFCNQEAVQFTDDDMGLCIYTYVDDPSNSELLSVKLFDYQGNHLELLENKEISKIIASCEFE